jgi:hypothetical protein
MRSSVSVSNILAVSSAGDATPTVITFNELAPALSQSSQTGHEG